jgi:hypothetical protein
VVQLYNCSVVYIYCLPFHGPFLISQQGLRLRLLCSYSCSSCIAAGGSREHLGSKPNRSTAASSSASLLSLALQDLSLQPGTDLVLCDKEPVVELPGVAEGPGCLRAVTCGRNFLMARSYLRCKASITPLLMTIATCLILQHYWAVIYNRLAVATSPLPPVVPSSLACASWAPSTLRYPS